MSKRLASLAGAIALAAFAAGPAFAASSAQAPTQQTRMKACNTQASTKALKGTARKTFMSQCLSGKTTAVSTKTTAAKEAKCKAEANQRKIVGAARASFMKKCAA